VVWLNIPSGIYHFKGQRWYGNTKSGQYMTEADAIKAQSSSSDAVTTLLPVGLGSKGGDFNKVYLDSFTRIVVKGEPVQTVLEDEAKILQGVLNDTKAPCWAPDPAGSGVCMVA